MIPFDFEDTEGKPGGSAILDRILTRLGNTFRSLQQAVTNDRLLVVTFPGAGTDVTVRHGLKGPVLTWEVVDKVAGVDVWRVAGDRERITFQASAAATVTIRVT
jgi:hypothetical protein